MEYVDNFIQMKDIGILFHVPMQDMYVKNLIRDCVYLLFEILNSRGSMQYRR